METYYTKKEYNEMKNALTKKCKLLEAKVKELSSELKEAKKDYKALFATITEEE